MSNSSDVVDGANTKTTDYNNLRADVLNTSTGHYHDGTNAKLQGYVNRGSTNNYDFLKTDLTIDGLEHTIDMSGLIPAGAKAVQLAVVYDNNTVGQYFSLQTATGILEKNKIFFPVHVASQAHWLEDLLALPTDRILYYYASNAGTWGSLSIVIRGWIM
jgi:hypothetical protein